MKSLYYVAAVTRVYRAALDAWREDPVNYRPDPQWRRELEAVSHRPYGTGFLFDQDQAFVHAEDSHYLRDCDFVGIVMEQEAAGDWLVAGRNRFLAGEALQLIGPAMRQSEFTFAGAVNPQGETITTVQPNALVRMSLPAGAAPGDLLRRWRCESPG